MRIVFMGTPDFSVNVLQGLIDNYKDDIVGVVSQPDRKVGRHQELKNTPVKDLALKYNILVLQPTNIKEEYDKVLELNPDIIITCAYGQIIPKIILDYPKYGCINVHASLLPKLRGGAPIHHALIDGYDKTGITIMYMDSKMDAGDIIKQKETEITDKDNLESLHDRLSIIGKDLLLEVLPSIIDGTNNRIKQNLDEVTFGYNITREEEHIDFNKSSREIFNLIRGLSPIPGANAILDGNEMKIYDCKIVNTIYNNIRGEIVDVNRDGFIVCTGDTGILITSIKPFGKKKMDASSFINGIGKDILIGKVFK